MHILIYLFVLVICNKCLLFALLFVCLFVCLQVDHDVTNASLYLCLFLYTYVPVYELKCCYV